jgi:hypothetical protein
MAGKFGEAYVQDVAIKLGGTSCGMAETHIFADVMRQLMSTMESQNAHLAVLYKRIEKLEGS